MWLGDGIVDWAISGTEFLGHSANGAIGVLRLCISRRLCRKRDLGQWGLTISRELLGSGRVVVEGGPTREGHVLELWHLDNRWILVSGIWPVVVDQCAGVVVLR